MSATKLDQWLDTDESRDVGYKEDGKAKSTGHESGRMIVKILHKKKSDYTAADIDQM